MKNDDYVFNLDNVKVKKKVIAPYRDENGNAKDWFCENGEKIDGGKKVVGCRSCSGSRNEP